MQNSKRFARSNQSQEAANSPYRGSKTVTALRIPGALGIRIFPKRLRETLPLVTRTTSHNGETRLVSKSLFFLGAFL